MTQDAPFLEVPIFPSLGEAGTSRLGGLFCCFPAGDISKGRRRFPGRPQSWPKAAGAGHRQVGILRQKPAAPALLGETPMGLRE